MKDTTDSDDSDDELGASIYKSSRTAKAREEAVNRAASKAPATHKNERLVCQKQTSRITCDMTAPKECSGISDDADLGCQRQQKDVLNKRKLSVEKDDGPVPSKRARKKCSVDECTKNAQSGGVCMRHGAKVKPCSHEGCTNIVVKGGVCVRHGAKVKVKSCSHEGCTNHARTGGVCRRHGAKIKVKKCSDKDVPTMLRTAESTFRHGAKVKICTDEGCTYNVRQGRVCGKHGAKARTCSHEG